jgi:hypothetical protein
MSFEERKTHNETETQKAKQMKILVCGGRDYTDKVKLFVELDAIHKERKITDVVHGGARGADTMAHDWARQNNIRIWPYPVTKQEWKTYGKGAGPIRNQRMLDEHPDIKLVVAFPGHAGTANMIEKAKATNIELIEFKS